ncbi:hypothetical protein PFICI_04390 [Pestalotiopsis fici W106-1]|uniref:Uncharacterized protein n=1 Tax=Pestalotiopsis fici (strain W106-1 / CGMCC3.15140) TaxID=1229662 RepID=W3X909_PESFW|nr:uncharacterized protein PFICI_04390 [Pestalotiopsis fici W106-1]ETS82514.1 hypothetical protein PFICI_04390 [Pestalotiopsis fici W106-1]
MNCKVQVFELEGDHTQAPRQFDDAMAMLRFWENTPKDGSESRTNRRIILLEDMVSRVNEILGVSLGIPPHFFLAHCDNFTDLRIIDDTFAAQNSSYWKVPFPIARFVPQTVPPGPYTAEVGNFSRDHFDIQPPGPINFNGYVSYWGRSYGLDSWTAVMLIDPPQAWLRQPNVSYELQIRFYPRDILHEVMISGNDVNRRIIQPCHRNMFEAAVQAHRQHPILHTQDPFTGSMYVRNLIRSAWEDKIMREATSFADVLGEDRDKYRVHQAVADTGKTAGTAYFDLMVKRQSIQQAKERILSIMWKFRLYDVDDTSKANDLFTTPEQAKNTRLQRYLEEDRQRQVYLSEEKRAWKMLFETQCSLESKAAEHMEMWSQRAARSATANGCGESNGTNIRPIDEDCDNHRAMHLCRIHFLHGRKVCSRRRPLLHLLGCLRTGHYHPACLGIVWRQHTKVLGKAQANMEF